MHKHAHTSIPVHEFIAERWSPRSFDDTATVDNDELLALIEAARWAPSAMNAQPWRFAVAVRGSQDFDAIVDALAPGNATWAPRAAAFVFVAAETQGADGNANPWALYDTGAAAALLTVQAHAQGLHVHQMGGYSKTKLRELFALPEHVQPLTVIAVGRVAEAEQLDSPLLERERAVRERRPVADLVLRGL